MPNTRQQLMLKLDGITAADYLTWVRDPEPAALDASLRSIDVEAEPLGDAIRVTLIWESAAPPPRSAAVQAGFPVSWEVVAVEDETRACGSRAALRSRPRRRPRVALRRPVAGR